MKHVQVWVMFPGSDPYAIYMNGYQAQKMVTLYPRWYALEQPRRSGN